VPHLGDGGHYQCRRGCRSLVPNRATFDMMRFIRGTILTFLSAVLLWITIALLFVRPNLSRIEDDYLSVSIGASHDDVKSKLSSLRETKVERKDVPKGYCETIEPSERFTIYRYDRLCKLFSFYVVYDEEEKVWIKFPQYE